MVSRNIVPIFVPHLGCPHDCAFCNQRKIANQDSPHNPHEIMKEIEKRLNWFKKEREVQIAFYGGSFTAIPTKKMDIYLQIGQKFIQEGRVDSLRISTRPDCIDEDILVKLKKYNVKTVELGLQSMDDEVLSANHRGHNSMATVNAVKKIKKHGFELGLQMMIGLYNESIKSVFFTANKIVDFNPNFVRIYPTLVLEETYLEKLYQKKCYIPLTLEETIDLLKKMALLFKRNNIPIIRIGLQPTEEINKDKVIAGPFHPSLRFLVEEAIYEDRVFPFLEKHRPFKTIEVKAPQSELNYLIGLKGRIKKKIIKLYQPEKIKYYSVENNQIQIVLDKKIYDLEEEQL